MLLAPHGEAEKMDWDREKMAATMSEALNKWRNRERVLACRLAGPGKVANAEDPHHVVVVFQSNPILFRFRVCCFGGVGITANDAIQDQSPLEKKPKGRPKVRSIYKTPSPSVF